jgi:hypothetical protein
MVQGTAGVASWEGIWLDSEEGARGWIASPSPAQGPQESNPPGLRREEDRLREWTAGPGLRPFARSMFVACGAATAMMS